MHDRLQRTTKLYNQLIQDNVYMNDDDRKDFIDTEETSFLKDSERDAQPHNSALMESSADDKNNKTLEFARMQALEDTLNDKRVIEMVEDIAMQLLQPSLPVISIKKLKNAVREAILERQISFLKQEESPGPDGEIKIKKVDLEDLRELVVSLIEPLQRAVYRDNKISLYNKDGVGLNFAIEDGCHEHLEKGDDAFYYSVFIQREQEALPNEDKK